MGLTHSKTEPKIDIVSPVIEEAKKEAMNSTSITRRKKIYRDYLIKHIISYIQDEILEVITTSIFKRMNPLSTEYKQDRWSLYYVETEFDKKLKELGVDVKMLEEYKGIVDITTFLEILKKKQWLKYWGFNLHGLHCILPDNYPENGTWLQYKKKT